jgi:hypothetical protein
MVDKVQKPITSKSYTPLSEPFRIYGVRAFLDLLKLFTKGLCTRNHVKFPFNNGALVKTMYNFFPTGNLCLDFGQLDK